MKRPLQLSLAIALAISGIDAMALGLGSIQVKSRLNQPLEAEIPVIQSNPGEAEGLIVQLASAEDFERVGLDRARSTAVPLEFKLVRNAQGQTVIRVTTVDAVRDPFVDFLIEANWTNGRLLREYTVLLDPPVMAAALKGSTTVAASPEPERAPVEPLPAATPKPAPKTSAAPPPVARAPAAPPAPRPATAEGDYAVQKGDTLSGIARQVRPGGDVSVDQTMLAIFKANPSAFYKDNINALKSGAILRIPDADSIRAVGSLREAAEQVRGQVEDWRGVAGSPTRIARTSGDAQAPASAASTGTRPTDDSRLAIVPPSVGKDSLAASDRVGASSAAGGNGDTRLKNELSRTQEALASREQETGELKSRVRELEDLKNKNDRLLSLKDSEIAELQQRLKALQDGQGGKTATTATPATAAPSAAPAGTTPPTGAETPSAPTKDDIWGRGDAATDSSNAAQTPAAATPVPTAPPVDPAATAPAATPETAATPAPVPGDAITATGSDTAPAAPPATPAKPPVAPPKPAAKTPPKPVTPPADSPWFMDPKVLGGAGAIGLLLVLLGVVGLRKRRKPVERSSIAESFGDSPLPAAALAGTAAVAAADPIEAALRAQIDANPADLGARLELLSHFYAERRVEDFEAGALDMNDYVIDRSQPEWLEVQAMGRELLPGNPLFAGPGGYTETVADAGDEAAYDEAFAFDAPVADPFEPAPTPAPATDFDFDFDAPSPARLDQPAAPPAAPADEDGFDFGDLPPLDFQSEIDAAARDTAERANLAEEAVPSASLEDEFFVGDDAVNTKLDLARTYLDMGDPDGARAMLEEVLSEGSQVQKDEARRLLDGIV